MLSLLVLCHQPWHVPTVSNTFAAKVDAPNTYEQGTQRRDLMPMVPICLYHCCLCTLSLQVPFLLIWYHHGHLCNPCHNHLPIPFLLIWYYLLHMEDLTLPDQIMKLPSLIWAMPHLDPTLTSVMKWTESPRFGWSWWPGCSWPFMCYTCLSSQAWW